MTLCDLSMQYNITTFVFPLLAECITSHTLDSSFSECIHYRLLLITNIIWSKNSTVFRGTRFHPLVLCGSSCTILWFLNSPSLFAFLYFLFLSFLDFLCLDKQYFQIQGNLSKPIMSFRVPFHLNCNQLWKACWRLRI
jgi:hypothetical protein